MHRRDWLRAAALAAIGTGTIRAQGRRPARSRKKALVELFTSQG